MKKSTNKGAKPAPGIEKVTTAQLRAMCEKAALRHGLTRSGAPLLAAPAWQAINVATDKLDAIAGGILAVESIVSLIADDEDIALVRGELDELRRRVMSVTQELHDARRAR